jgi:hypothetical protein
VLLLSFRVLLLLPKCCFFQSAAAFFALDFCRREGNCTLSYSTTGCPHNSWVHEVERIMSIVNLALSYGVALERPQFVTLFTTNDDAE